MFQVDKFDISQTELGTVTGDTGSPGVTAGKINSRREVGSVTVLLPVSVPGGNIVREIAANDRIAQVLKSIELKNNTN